MKGMQENRLDLTTEYLAELINHWMLFPPVMLIMHFSGAKRPDLLMWALSGLFPLLFTLIRIRQKKFLTFLGSHLAVTFLSLVIPTAGKAGRLLCIFCAVYYMVSSCAASLKQKASSPEPLPSVLAVAVSALAFLLHYYQGDIRGWEKYYMVNLIGCLALCNIVQYLQRYLDFISLNRSSAGQFPAREILRSGLGLVLGYTLLGSILMLLGTNAVWLERLAGVIKGGLLAILRAFFSLFRSRGEQNAAPEQAASPPEAQMPLLPEAGEPSWFWKLLEIAVGVVLTCLFVCGVIIGVISLVRWIREHFLSGLFPRRKTAEDDVQDIRERCILPERERHPSGGFFLPFLSPSARIRRLYKKTVLLHSAEASKERSILPSLTARESEKMTGLTGMAEIYEQARYSERKLTGEDVRRMKAACSGQKAAPPPEF